MKSAFLLPAAVACYAVSAQGQAQKAALPVRPLGRIVTTSKEMLTNIASIRQLSDGRVIANDPVGHRVVVFDSSLSQVTVIADTTSGTKKAYGTSLGGIIPYMGDSTLFLDVASLSFLVISPRAQIDHVMAVPKTQDILSMASPTSGAAFDPQGRLIYRQTLSLKGPANSMGASKAGADPASLLAPSDSSPIVRIDLKTRKLDTIAQLRVQQVQYQVDSLPTGGTIRRSLRNPLPLADDWALMADGSVAIIRAQDYHIDFIAPDGSRSASGKIPHEWVRLTDSDKVALVDSAKRADSLMAIQTALAAANGNVQSSGQVGMTFTQSGAGGGGAATGSADVAMKMLTDGGGGGGGGTRIIISNGDPNGGGLGPSALSGLNFSQPQYVAAADLPDYRPAFLPGAKADADGNLWIRITQAAGAASGAVYEVVNRKGELVDRVQIPGGCSVVGFAPGIVYLVSRDGVGMHLARARIH